MPDGGDRSWLDESGMYDDQVIDAAYLHSCPNCYFIGPFAKRVSFTSQQYRAIDLVEALRRKGKLTEGTRVAVIGAGLAGLMTAAALRGLHCKKVHLYEAKAVMHRQIGASHRVVHPTISRWPMEPLSLTTKFPFLDWFAAPCDKIIEYLMGDWNENLNPDGAPRGFKFRKMRVKGIFFPEGIAGVLLDTSPSVKDLYDIVFVTTGFADEHTVGEFKATSYWAVDDIARRTSDDLKQWQEGSRILVSGCGDGGLIDCLRIVHGHFRDGWLTIELAEMLDSESGIRRLIERAEHDALTAARSIACMRLEPDFRKDAARNTKYMTALTKAYHEAVGQLPAKVIKLLDNSIAASRMPIGRVILVAKAPTPFVPYSAPIHKLMLAHALQSAHISYISGQVDYRNGVPHVEEQSGDKSEISDAVFIVRHGAPADMIGPIGREELGSLKIRQLLMADYIDRKTERIIEPPPDYPKRHDKIDKERFIALRFRMAKALVQQIAPQIRLTANLSGFRYVRTKASPSEESAAASTRLRLPLEPFGIKAEYVDLEYADHQCLL